MEKSILVRRLDLSTFVGDVWAVNGFQSGTVPDSELDGTTGLTCAVVAGPVRWVVVAYDGMGDRAEPVVDTVTTVDARLVKYALTQRGSAIVVMNKPLTVTSGAEQLTGQEILDEDVTPGQRFILGIPTLTIGTAPALWVFLTAGAKTIDGSKP